MERPRVLHIFFQSCSQDLNRVLFYRAVILLILKYPILKGVTYNQSHHKRDHISHYEMGYFDYHYCWLTHLVQYK